MATTCFKPVFGKRIRLTRLDACGNVVPAAETSECVEVVSDGFITLTLSSETEDGSEIVQKNAAGVVAISQKSPDSFKRFTLEMEFVGVDPYLLSFMTNMQPYLNGTDAIGAVAYEGVVDDKFALELWTGLAGQACDPGVEEASGYLLLPFLNAGVLGDIEVTGEDAVTFSVQGAYTVSGNNWGVGPYNVLLSPPAVNEVQRVTITGTPTGGTFTLTYAGQTTAPIAYNAAAAAVQSALEALSNIAPGDVTATGGPLPGSFVTLTFGGSLAGQDVAAITATGSLTGGTAPAVSITTPTGGSAGTPSALPVPLEPDQPMLIIETGVAPPPALCGCTTMGTLP